MSHEFHDTNTVAAQASGTFGLRLRLAREAREMSQADLAALCNLPPSSISDFEAGRRKPTFSNLYRLTAALDVTSDSLLDGEVAAHVNVPRAYELSDREEFFRLARECAGYLKVCHDKHGTDWEGRRFAMLALEAIWKGRVLPTAGGRS